MSEQGREWEVPPRNTILQQLLSHTPHRTCPLAANSRQRRTIGSFLATAGSLVVVVWVLCFSCSFVWCRLFVYCWKPAVERTSVSPNLISRRFISPSSYSLSKSCSSLLKQASCRMTTTC